MNRSRMLVPPRPKIYHILHVDRIASIASDGFLWSDAQMTQRHSTGTTIGMSNIKQRRQKELYLTCHPGLHVGDCVPFYFGPRSVMLFLIHKRNPDLTYGGGQELVVHLEADLRRAVEWAQQRRLRWAFALSNAGAYYFESRSDIAALSEINWDAVYARTWSGPGVSPSVKEGKQAEFLIESAFPWQLIETIGMYSLKILPDIISSLKNVQYRPKIELKPEWYY